jgi:hypothetical protein
MTYLTIVQLVESAAHRERTKPDSVSSSANSQEEKIPMMKKYLIGTALASVLAVSASAQVATEYYVVQDTATKRCTIVDKKPTTTSVVQVGPMAFKTRTEAEAGMKTITVCSSN